MCRPEAAMPNYSIPNNWAPRRYQFPLWEYLQDGGKRACAVWHRRAGKDEVALHWTATQLVLEPGTYWHMLPEYAQARKAIWQAVNPHTGMRRIDEAIPREIRRRTNDQEMTIETTSGSMWHVVGSDSYNRLVGSPPRGVVLSEFALGDPAVWGFLSPILAENNGWALFIYTPRGKNHGYELYERARQSEGWYSELLRADQTGVIEAAAIEEARADNHALYGPEIGDMVTEQEFFCSWEGGLPGAYYARQVSEAERNGRITSVPVDPAIPVDTAWDLGKTDSTAIWCFQVAGGQIRVVDYYEGHGLEIEDYVRWLRERNYNGTDWLPHDARAEILGMKRTRVEQMMDLGRKPRIVPMYTVADGINAVRMALPICHFDAEKTEPGLNCLRSYHRKYDDKRKVFLDTPNHDWASHGADAFRYLAVAWQKEMAPQAKPEFKMEVRLPTMAEVMKQHERAVRAKRQGEFI